MARYSVSLQTYALTASDTQTVIQILTGAQDQAKIIEWGVGFDGSTATAPILCGLRRQTSAGSGGTAFTPRLMDPDDGTSAASALTGIVTTEPTAGDTLVGAPVAANNGVLVVQYPLGREPRIGKSGRMGLITITPAGVSPNCSAYVLFEELASYMFRETSIALAGGATKTLMQIVAGAQNQVRLKEFGIGFDLGSASQPIRVDMLRQTSAGTFTNATNVPLLMDPSDGTSAANVQTVATGEPTAGDILGSWQVEAFNGLFVIQWPKDEGPKIGLSGRLGFRVVTPAGVAPSASIYAIWEE